MMSNLQRSSSVQSAGRLCRCHELFRVPTPLYSAKSLSNTAKPSRSQGMRSRAQPSVSATIDADLAEENSLPPPQPFTSTSESRESEAFAVEMARVANDTKGGDIMVLNIAPLVFWCSYFVIVTAYSKPQLNALVGKMKKDAKERWDRELKEGQSPGSGPWEVLDFGDVIVHVFTAEQRENYDLESFYGAAEEVELPFAVGSPDLGWQRQV